MSAGRGPDIVNSILMKDYIEGMLEKGTLEELNPYMEASGIREEDYFPLTFASLRQGEHIYGVNPSIVVWDTEISEDVLGSREVPNIEALADILLARNEKGIYRKGYNSAEVLESFLQGTESLWGMIDWENGSCDFDSPLFGKLLEAAKRYGDDGCYPVSEWVYALSINANSLHKEAAWEFICFLISEEAQLEDSTSLSMPLHKEAFDAWMQKCIDKYAVVGQENGVSVPMYNGRAITDEMQAEFKEKIEAARPLPIRPVPILDIILEEAKAYFDGYKNEQDVVAVINKRVQLYLDERK